MSERPLKVLVFTTLYPSVADPVHGVFVENRLRQLVASGQVEARVVAPVPWFPFRSERFGRYGTFARKPAAEERHGPPPGTSPSMAPSPPTTAITMDVIEPSGPEIKRVLVDSSKELEGFRR